MSFSTGWTLANIGFSFFGIVALSAFLAVNSSSERINEFNNITSSFQSVEDIVEGSKEVATRANLVILTNQLLLVASPAIVGVLLTILFLILSSFPSLGLFHITLDPAVLRLSGNTMIEASQPQEQPMSMQCYA